MIYLSLHIVFISFITFVFNLEEAIKLLWLAVIDNSHLIFFGLE